MATAVELSTRPTGPPPGSAAEALLATDLVALRDVVDRATPADVDRALRVERRGLPELAVLLSTAAVDRLEDMAQAAHRVTVHRFGRAARLFAPLYLSNECVSVCTYCGFSAGNAI